MYVCMYVYVFVCACVFVRVLYVCVCALGPVGRCIKSAICFGVSNLLSWTLAAVCCRWRCRYCKDCQPQQVLVSSWVPLGSISPEQGSLFVLKASHTFETKCDITEKFSTQAEVGGVSPYVSSLFVFIVGVCEEATYLVSR